MKAAEELWQIFGQNADARIADDQDHLIVFLLHLQFNCAAFGRELERVFEQIVEGAVQLHPVTVDDDFVFGEMQRKAAFGLFGARSESLCSFGHQRPQLDRLRVRCRL